MEKDAKEIPRHPRTRLYNDDKVFSVSWFNACLQETLLPGKPWHKVLEILEAALADEVKHQIRDATQREMVFHLVGQSFVERYFHDYPLQPNSLFSDMRVLNSVNLEETRVWLQNQCFKAAENIHCQFHFGTDAAELAPEMVHFLDDAYNIVIAEMESSLANCEAWHEGKGAQESEAFCQVPQPALSREPRQTSFAVQRPKSIESKDIRLTLSQRPTSQINGKEEGSESMSTVCERLSGKLLPKTLRQFIWIDKLLRSGSESYMTQGLISVEKEARERFGQTVAQRAAKLKLRSATRSPLSGLIENAVVETYGSVPCMCPFAANEQVILESSKSLNVLYVFNGAYEPYLIHWLFPLQMAFKPITPKEHPYELAMYLHSLHGKLFPTWAKVLAMAEAVMSLLEREDAEFFAHLQQAFKKNITVDPKDFLVELMLQEKGGAQGIGGAFENEFQPWLNVTKELLASPVIFLRKWMGEGFVGVLSLPAVLLIWDQLFMQDWDPRVMQNFCASILLLLKDSFMAAADYGAIREVFLSRASHLLTADIRRAWIHLQQGGLPADIPGLNRLNQRPLVDPSPLRHGSAEAFGDMRLGFEKISPIGVKDILLRIVLPVPQAEAPHTEAILQNFEPSAVKLTVSVCCGSQKLRSKTSAFSSPHLQKTQEKTASLHGTEFSFHFSESFVFDSLDPTAFVDTQDSKPYLLFKIMYGPKGKDSLTLGWQKVDAFQQETTCFGIIWTPRELSMLVPLIPGDVPDTIVDYPFGWLPKDVAGGRSTLRLTAYDAARRSLRLQSGRVRRERLQEPSFLYAPWVPHDPGVVLPDPPRVNQPFDLYIDALRYIPDNATITKVTGHFRNSVSSHLHRIVAFPVLESSSRNPEFQYRASISGGVSDGIDENTWLLFEVHTVDVDSRDLVLLGSCAIRVFNAQGQLNVGGFQLKLRAGLLEEGPWSLTPSLLSRLPVVSGCTLLLRLLPSTQMPVAAPSYLTGYYFTDGAKPNNSELGIIASFQKDNSFPERVLDMAVQLSHEAQSRVLPDQLEAWCVGKLDEGGDLSPQRLLKCIDLHRAVRYRQEAGLRVRIKQAFGLKADGYYVNALARILKGAASMRLHELPQRWGGDEKFLMRQLDFTSLQRSPRWTDSSVVLHPHLDDHSVLLVQVYGLDVLYTPDPSGQRPGEVAPRSGQALELNAQSQLGWTALPLFDRSCVRSGVHSAPLFQGVPSGEFLQRVRSRPVKEVMAEGLRNKRLKLLATYGSVIVELWDGHYFDGDCHELPHVTDDWKMFYSQNISGQWARLHGMVLNDLLSIGKIRKFLETQASKNGKDMSQLLLKTLDKKLRKLGRSSLEYRQQEDFYKQAMGNAFYNIVETALLNAGYGPL